MMAIRCAEYKCLRCYSFNQVHLVPLITQPTQPTHTYTHTYAIHSFINIPHTVLQHSSSNVLYNKNMSLILCVERSTLLALLTFPTHCTLYIESTMH